MRSVKRVILAISLVLLTACGGTIDSSVAAKDPKTGKVDLVRTYNLTYSESMDKTAFRAQFKENRTFGKDIRLTGHSSIAVNGEAVPEDSVIDKNGAGEVAAFYAGLVFPLFWVFMADNGYVHYDKVYPFYLRSVYVEFIDPENELHSNQFKIPKANFFIPNLFSDEKIKVLVSDDEEYSSVHCSVIGDVETEVVELETASNGDTIEKSKFVVEAKAQTFYKKNGIISISRNDLEEYIGNKVTIECEASKSEKLMGGAGGTVNIIYKSTPQSIKL